MDHFHRSLGLTEPQDALVDIQWFTNGREPCLVSHFPKDVLITLLVLLQIDQVFIRDLEALLASELVGHWSQQLAVSWCNLSVNKLVDEAVEVLRLKSTQLICKTVIDVLLENYLMNAHIING